MLIRLQKIISMAGVASRRKAEEIIRSGGVTVNGRVITEMGSKADPDKDHVKVLGKLVQTRQPKVYLMLHKPRGVVSTLSDPLGRPTVKDFLRGIRARVYPVGRLDYDSEGLLLLTNDGEIVQRLLHPSRGIPKIYEVKIKGVLPDEEIVALTRGVKLSDGPTLPCRIRKMKKTEKNSWLEITLTEGRNRQIRRMLESMDRMVLKIKRKSLGPFELRGLPPGEFRHLTPAELRELQALPGEARGKEKKAPAARLRRAATRQRTPA